KKLQHQIHEYTRPAVTSLSLPPPKPKLSGRLWPGGKVRIDDIGFAGRGHRRSAVFHAKKILSRTRARDGSALELRLNDSRRPGGDSFAPAGTAGDRRRAAGERRGRR